MSLKLGNLAINKIYLGSTLINKVYLGANQVYPTGGGGGGTVIEGFESFSGGLPNTLAWTKVGNPTITQSSSHVTQGSFSCRVVETGGGAAGIELVNGGAAFVDLTGYVSLSLDVYIESISGTFFFEVYKHPSSEFVGDFSTALTGVHSPSINITGAGEVYIFIQSNNNCDFYVDNLLAE